MPRFTPAELAAKFQTGVSGGGAAYAHGVRNPAKDWLASYQKASPRMKAELQKALAEDRHLKGATAAGTQKWQDNTIKVGEGHYTTAAPRAAAEYAKQAADILAAGDMARSVADQMPDTTIEQRIQRSAAAQLAVSDFWKGRK